jgi:hypothetical protein
MTGRRILVIVMLAALLLTTPAAYAQDKARERALTAGAKIDQKKVEAAAKKGCDWLRAKQRADGCWQPAEQKCRGRGLFLGTTALVLLALLKGGEDPNADCIKKGFNFIFQFKPDKYRAVYEVAVLILALAARYEPDEEPEEKEIKKELGKKDLTRTTLFDPPEKKQKKKFKHAPKAVRKWFTDALAWLLSKQNGDGGWGYGFRGTTEVRTDASNSQYVSLALHAATRCGMKVSAKVFAGLAQYMLLQQEKTGPEIEGFPVPVADFDIKKLKEMEKEYLDNLRKQLQDARDQGEEITPEKLKKMTTTVPEIEDPYRKFGVELKKIKARGWGYVPQTIYPTMPADDVLHKPIGSMTCSGVAALCVAKANLEGSGWYRKHKKALNRGIRDGCGWLAHNFTVQHNPHSPREWHYYYLYGLERAGILALVRDFGKHNWYADGGNYLLGAQNGDGSWPGELSNTQRNDPSGRMRFTAANLSPMVNTCFAILFLKRATAPVVKIPDDPYTGADLFGGRTPKKKDENK